MENIIKTKEEVALETLKFMTKLNKTGSIKAIKKVQKIKEEVQKAGGVHKGATGQAGKGRFSYADGDAVYKLITPLFAKNKILAHYSLVPGTRKVRPHKNHNGNDQYDWIQTLHFQFIDAESGEMVQGFWDVAGTQKGDLAKTFGTALTYSIRYFLLKYFDIATDKDDADAKKPEPIAVKESVTATAKSLPAPKKVVAKPAPATKPAPKGTEESKAAQDIFRTFVKTQTTTAKFKKEMKAVVEEVTGEGSMASIKTVAQANEIVAKLGEK